jgi:hypothetical protein
MTANASSPMTSIELGAAAAARRQYPRAAVAKATPRTTLRQYLWVGLESFILLVLFMVLAGTALYLRARLGLVR